MVNMMSYSLPSSPKCESHDLSTSPSNPLPFKDMRSPNKDESLDTVIATPPKPSHIPSCLALKPIPHFPNQLKSKKS